MSHALFINVLPELDLANSFLALSKVLADIFCPPREECPDQIRDWERSIPLFPSRHKEQIDSAEESLACFPGESTKKSLPELLHRLMSYRWWHVGVERIGGTDGP